MLIDFISDIHLDFWIDPRIQGDKLEEKIKHFTEETLGTFGGNILIISGDLGHYFTQNSAFLRFLKKIYQEVIVVTGNHDLYLVSKSQENIYHNDSWERVREMKKFCGEIGVRYLDGDIVEIQGLVFGGVGMSWDNSFLEKNSLEMPGMDYVMDLFRKEMNDGNFIFSGKGSRFNPLDYFKEEMKKLRNISHADIMVSHYSPIVPGNMTIGHLLNPASNFYFFGGEDEVRRIDPICWVFGHTHTRYNFREGETTLLCNPLGYPGEINYRVGSIEV